MCPYVNFEGGAAPRKGWFAFYDPPRYSSGYAALFQTMAFVPETHMLKPYLQRVQSTYRLMASMIKESSKQAKELIESKKEAEKAVLRQTEFALAWTIDSSRWDTIAFKGYEAVSKVSEVTGMPRLYYDHSKPFEKKIIYYNYYKPGNIISAPKAYIIPQGWHEVIDILKLNGVVMNRFLKDTTIETETYKIEDYKSFAKPYEKHHKNYDIVTTKKEQSIHFLKGDYIVFCNQPCKRYLVEMLEPSADDSFFSWNFFDAILQQKEGYSDYRWEDVAADYLRLHPQIKQLLEDKKKTDTAFAASSTAQLNFVYKNSPYYEPSHLRYPVYRVVK
ncbi:MAG: Gll2474 protein [uncultured Segetibacter sp.]|uniref:Gll2474 protein n=1 Tax=uncultured Segetibacter sp. TaxID=481133 RepID=A0A6J4SVM2_9BACT|nr:MAG: Gll2474 protein [uncultured Segetibacter sp.]